MISESVPLHCNYFYAKKYGGAAIHYMNGFFFFSLDQQLLEDKNYIILTNKTFSNVLWSLTDTW